MAIAVIGRAVFAWSLFLVALIIRGGPVVR